MAKVMNLVDPRILERLPPVPPVVRQLNVLDEEMKNIIDREDIRPEEKVTRYNQVLQRYMRYYDKPYLDKSSYHGYYPTREEEDGEDTKLEREIDTVVPGTFKKKAKMLLNHIRDNPNMKWNDKRELIVEGEKINDSHVLDLVGHALRHRSSAPVPKGSKEFARALKRSNISQELVGNKHFWKQMHSDDDDDDRIITPPPRQFRRIRAETVLERAKKKKRNINKDKIPWTPS